MNIIPATPDLLESLVQLFDQYRQFYNQPADPAGARAFLSERLARKDSVIYLASESIDDLALGFVQLYPSFSSVAMKPLWILNDLFVTKDGRRQGVAEQLIRRAERHARETNARGLILETAIDNLPARRLYERLGWVVEKDFLTYKIDF